MGKKKIAVPDFRMGGGSARYTLAKGGKVRGG